MAAGAQREQGRSIGLIVMAVVCALIGLIVGGLGAWLAGLGGSIYYLLAGLALLATAFLLFRRNALALWVYAALLAVTLIWALWEVGTSISGSWRRAATY